MMLIVSGDQHIKVSNDLPLDWQLKRFRALWQQYLQLCLQHEAHLILTGDMFHNAKPNLHEAMLFMELCQLLDENSITTHIIAGNHENMGANGTTLDYFQPLFDGLEPVTYHRDIAFLSGGKNSEFVFVGHNQLQQWLDSGDDEWSGTRIIFSHFRPTVNRFIQEEIDVQKFLSTGDYFFLGDIHSDLSLAANAVYTNAPVNNHFESAPKCGCLLVTCTVGKVTWQRLPLALPNLIQIDTTAEQFEDPLDSYNYYRVTVTGTPDELRKIRTQSPNTKLLKIPDVDETYAELEVAGEVKNQTLLEALDGYMQELQFSEEKRQRMMEVYLGA